MRTICRAKRAISRRTRSGAARRPAEQQFRVFEPKSARLMTLLQSARDARPRSNRFGGVAALLGALLAFAAGHQTLAQNATDASGGTPGISDRYQLAAYMESRGVRHDGSGNNGKISSSAGRSRGKRCGMSPGEFAKFYPPLFDWIRATLTSSAHLAQSVASREFFRDYRSISPNKLSRRQKL